MTMAQLLALLDVETEGSPAGLGRAARPEEWIEGAPADWAFLSGLRLGG